MGATLDFYLDSTGKGLLNGGSVQAGGLPTFYRNDNYKVRVRVVDTALGTDAILNSPSFKLGIGEIDKVPSDGQFKLTLAGPVTSSAIPYNATTTQVFNAVSAIAGNVSVTTYGSTGSGWVIQAATAGSSLSFGGVAFTLFPTSSVLISTKRNGVTADGIKAEQIIQLARSPAVFSDVFTPSAVTSGMSLTKTQDGSASLLKSETYLLKVGNEAVGGSFILSYGANSTTGIAIGTDAFFVQTALGAVTGIGSPNNVAVQSNSARTEYTIAFTRALANQDLSTNLTLDATGVLFANLYETTVTMATAELDTIFGETDQNSKTLTLEIELTDGGNKTTLLQRNITVRRDLISTGSAVPSPQASFYTKTETDNLFVEDSTANVDATNRKLLNAGGNTVINYGTGAIGDATTTSLGFFGASPIARPSGANAVSNVISLGLLPSSATYGVLPGTIRTLTTTASINFGAVDSNDTVTANVTITGSAINDIVLIGLPTSVCPGLTFYGHVISSNTVEIDAVNGTNNNQVQSEQTYRITVIGY